MVQLFGRGLFPSTVVEAATVDMAERVLADTALPAAARRSVVDRRDEVLRGLRARAAENAR
jgi:hypothetical protein